MQLRMHQYLTYVQRRWMEKTGWARCTTLLEGVNPAAGVSMQGDTGTRRTYYPWVILTQPETGVERKNKGP